jgi:glycosyltransferase involved in cell wall biosynthesis
MRFAVDAHAIGRHLTGNEVYVRSLLAAFAQVDKDSAFTAYLSSQDAAQAVPRRFDARYVSANPFFRLGVDLPRALHRDRPNLLHVQYTAPLWCPVPVVVSVHDVSFLEHPEYFTRTRRSQLKWSVKRTVDSAAAIITGSSFSRDRILAAYPVPEQKVHVVPDAASTTFRPLGRERAQARIQQRFGCQFPFVLSVGDLQPRKNQIGLISAFAQLLRAEPRLTHHLVLAGKDTWFSGRVREAARESGVGDRIHFTGFVTDDDLLELYNACDCFAFPSYYEGFGIPILEAMACGRAVACANTSSMPEVADGAGLLFDPYRSDEIARALRDLLLDAELRGRMERLGVQRAALFSWQRTAELTLDVYRSVARLDTTAASKRQAALQQQ